MNRRKNQTQKTSSKKTCQTNLDLALFPARKNTSNNLLQGGVFFSQSDRSHEKIHKKTPYKNPRVYINRDGILIG